MLLKNLISLHNKQVSDDIYDVKYNFIHTSWKKLNLLNQHTETFRQRCMCMCVGPLQSIPSPYGGVYCAQVNLELGTGEGDLLRVPIVCPQSLQRERAAFRASLPASNMANECMSEYKDE